MFGSIGGFEMLVLVLLGLLIFGPRRLPEIGRTLGRMMGEFRRATTDLRTSIEREVSLEEMRRTGQEIQSSVRDELSRSIEPVVAPIREALPRIASLPAALDPPEEPSRADKPPGPDDAVRTG